MEVSGTQEAAFTLRLMPTTPHSLLTMPENPLLPKIRHLLKQKTFSLLPSNVTRQTFLAVQWLRLPASTAGSEGFISCGELRSHMLRGVVKKEKK